MDLKKYFEIGYGTCPIILSCPHGGYKKPKRIPFKTKGAQIVDTNTYFISKQIIQELKERNIKIYYVLSKIHRSKIDLNRPPGSEHAFNQISSEARNIHFAYQDQLVRFAQDCVSNYTRALLIDFHGFTKPEINYPDVIFGHVFGKTLDLTLESEEQNCNRYWGCSQLYEEISKFFTLDDGLALTNYNIAYSGGYITQRFYNKNQISAIQIEIAKYIRLDTTLTKNFIRAIVNAIIKSLS